MKPEKDRSFQQTITNIFEDVTDYPVYTIDFLLGVYFLI